MIDCWQCDEIQQKPHFPFFSFSSLCIWSLFGLPLIHCKHLGKIKKKSGVPNLKHSPQNVFFSDLIKHVEIDLCMDGW